jgi:AhpD family alkylhydroperoxidase
LSDVQIHTTRLDPTANEALMAIANAGAAAFGHTAELTLDGQLAQLLRLRVAQINNCTYCLNVHYGAARALGVPQAKIAFLTAWWETRLFSDAERAALEYAEALTRASDTTVTQAFQQYHDKLTAHFDEAAMLEIVAVVVNMNVWTRLKLAEGAMPCPRSVDPPPAAPDPTEAFYPPEQWSRAGAAGLTTPAAMRTHAHGETFLSRTRPATTPPRCRGCRSRSSRIGPRNRTRTTVASPGRGRRPRSPTADPQEYQYGGSRRSRYPPITWAHRRIQHGIAVGTALTSGPPRRSQRAELPHWAPASGSGVEAHGGYGVPGAGGW